MENVVSKLPNPVSHTKQNKEPNKTNRGKPWRGAWNHSSQFKELFLLVGRAWGGRRSQLCRVVLVKADACLPPTTLA
jgi:hypothetical protein